MLFNNDTASIIIYILIAFSIFMAIVLLISMLVTAQKAARQEKLKNTQEDNGIDLEAQFLNATVVHKRIFNAASHYIGMGIYEYSLNYFISFLMESGEELEYAVSQEMFEKTEENQTGTLVLVNGSFFDFGEGEEIQN